MGSRLSDTIPATRILIDFAQVDVPFVPVDFLHSEALAKVSSSGSAQVFLHPTAKPPPQTVRQPFLHIQDSDGPLQFPDAGTLHGDLLHGVIHEGDEHVEQQDVGEYDVADEENVENLPVLVVLCELHVAHADCELEELQRGVGDGSEGGIYTILLSDDGT